MRQYPEDNLQMAVCTYLDSKGLLWAHQANERKTTMKTNTAGVKFSLQGSRLKKKGVKSGVPDCVIYEPTEEYNGLAIELKVKGGKVSDNQKKWLKALKERGWFTAVCYDIEEVVEVVEKYLKG